jgi:hypothetical protein
MEKIIFCDRNYLSIAFNSKLPGFFQAAFFMPKIFLKQKIGPRLIIRPAIQYKSGTAPTHLTLTGLSLTIGARIQL